LDNGYPNNSGLSAIFIQDDDGKRQNGFHILLEPEKTVSVKSRIPLPVQADGIFSEPPRRGRGDTVRIWTVLVGKKPTTKQ